MNLKEFLDQVLFSIGETNITVGGIFISSLITLLLAGLHRLTIHRWLPRFFSRQEINDKDRKKILRTANICFVLIFIISLILSLDLNIELLSTEERTFRISGVAGILLAWQLARFTDLMLSRMLARNYSRRQGEEHPVRTEPTSAVAYHYRTVQYVVYFIALFILVNAFGLNRSFTIPLGKEPLSPSVSDFIGAIIVILIARVFIWILTQLVLSPYYQRKDINIGSQYAINQLISYIFYVIAIILALQTLGIQMTLIWGGAAALLVGVGLGLQQTFNDFFSGLVLLFERSVEVGDIVNISGLIGTVRRIGLRASHIQTRDNLTVIVPNSKLVVDNVINWSHNDNRARFWVAVGVSYGSDTQMIKDLLIQTAQKHEKVLNFPRPFVRFTDFGDSSLNFEIHFWTTEFVRIEDVKSDLRFAIDQAFRENGVTIPFPQRDLWFKNPLHQENFREAPKAENRPEMEEKRED